MEIAIGSLKKETVRRAGRTRPDVAEPVFRSSEGKGHQPQPPESGEPCPPRHGTPRHALTAPTVKRAVSRTHRSPPVCAELGQEVAGEATSTAQKRKSKTFLAATGPEDLRITSPPES